MKNNFFLFCSFVVLCASPSEDQIVVNLITTNDLHGQIVGQKARFMNPEYPPDIMYGSALYSYIQKLRQDVSSTNEDVLLLEGGNFFQGHPFGLADSGRTMIEWMNRIKYDALVPGGYDFIGGASNLLNLNELADFPFLVYSTLDEFSLKIKED